MINIKKERIEIPIYFFQKENKEVVIDYESIYNTLKKDLLKIEEKPEQYLCIEN